MKEEVRGYSGGPGGEGGGIAERKFFCQGRLLLSLTCSTFHSPRHTLHAHTCAYSRIVRRTSAFDRKVLGARIRHDSSTSAENIQLKVKRSALEHNAKKRVPCGR